MKIYSYFFPTTPPMLCADVARLPRLSAPSPAMPWVGPRVTASPEAQRTRKPLEGIGARRFSKLLNAVYPKRGEASPRGA